MPVEVQIEHVVADDVDEYVATVPSDPATTVRGATRAAVEAAATRACAERIGDGDVTFVDV